MSTIKASPRAALIAKRHNLAVAARRKGWADDEARRHVKPTKQRLEKGDLEQQPYESGLRYRPKDDYLATHKSEWASDIVNAFYRLQDDSIAADVTGVTAGYGTAKSPTHRSAVGGLRHKDAEMIDRFTRHDWVMRRLTPDLREVCENFILNRVPVAARRQELLNLGRRLRPKITEERCQLARAEGFILAAGRELITLYEAFEIQKRGDATRK